MSYPAYNLKQIKEIKVMMEYTLFSIKTLQKHPKMQKNNEIYQLVITNI